MPSNEVAAVGFGAEGLCSDGSNGLAIYTSGNIAVISRATSRASGAGSCAHSTTPMTNHVGHPTYVYLAKFTTNPIATRRM